MSGAVRTTCAYCGVGCGIVATPAGARGVTIKGDPDHPANAGRLCSKGTHLGETVGLEGRLLHPMIGKRRASWDKALDLVAKKFRDTIARHGPDSVAFYVSGQLLTEDYYVANKLMKGFIGSANIDTNSRLCMSSAVAGHMRAFGEDVVPVAYDDLEQADLITLVGSNTAWCHPIVYQRIQAARTARGAKLVVVDPRRTETCDDADLHLAIRPGPADLARFYELFAGNSRAITLFSQGINQALRGTDQVNAITNLHLATGRIGKTGAGPFSITGQPNAMGGREVGGLASTLAAHMDFAPENVARVGRFWASPGMATKPGLKAVDLFRGVREGRIKALWVMATNPAVSMPDANMVRDALATCPFVVVSDVIAETDTSLHAHVRLPATGWGEKDGTVTNSERCISRQRPFLTAPGEARHDWWIVTQIGRRMGWKTAFAFDNPADVYREHARLSAYQNDGERLFDLRRHAAIGNADYDALEPFRWGGAAFADGRYSTLDRKARLIKVAQASLADPLRDWPLTLNTGRYRDQWHTMTRTGLSAKLARHREEPLVEVHPEDAVTYGLADGGLARVATAQGESLFRVAVTDRQRPGELFTPIHWTDRQSTGGRTGLLPRPLVDPHSGQPGFKLTPARIEKIECAWRGFLLVRGTDTPPPKCLWRTRITVPGGLLYELAGNGEPDRLAASLPNGAQIEARDKSRGSWRVAVLDKGRIAAALFVTATGELPPRDWLIAQLEAPEVAPTLLAGRAPGVTVDRGPVICVCFDIGMQTILSAIAEQKLTDVAAVGKALNAGTNCGSCRPAIAHLIAQSELAHAS
ncbi:MAG: molybdopterin-dependent oxidoreductase [Sphingomonas sp.]|nr:molybdopterin-dependent oxidoreductase [Sphingomonas sp.]